MDMHVFGLCGWLRFFDLVWYDMSNDVIPAAVRRLSPF